MKSTSLDQTLHDAIKETRTVSKIISLGSTCLACFVSNPFVIERHHIGGRKHCSVTIPLCANCHLLASKNQLFYGRNWLKPYLSEPEQAYYVVLIGKESNNLEESEILGINENSYQRFEDSSLDTKKILDMTPNEADRIGISKNQLYRIKKALRDDRMNIRKKTIKKLLKII